jgi:hypothetical protein
MQTPAKSATQPLLATQVEMWIQTMVGKHEALYRQLREAEHTADGERVFQEVSRLLYEAIEAVRMLGAQLREQRTALQARPTELLGQSQRSPDRRRSYHKH